MSTLTENGRMPQVTPAASAPPLRKEALWRRRDRLWGLRLRRPSDDRHGAVRRAAVRRQPGARFRDWDGLTDLTWVGFANFADQLTDPLLGRAILNTLIIAIVTVPIGLGLSVIVAVALEKLKTRTLYLILFFAPVCDLHGRGGDDLAADVPLRRAAVHDDLEGLRGHPARLAAGPEARPPRRLHRHHLVVDGPQRRDLPRRAAEHLPSVIEAARIDGAGPWRLFTSIRLPLLSPIVFFSSVVAFISSLQTFDTVYVLVQDAGPDNATRTIVYHIFDLGFGRFEFGPSSAASIILLLLTLVITAVQFGAQKKFVHYEDDPA